ncbi:MAG: UMP kinase [Pseudomonadota bacterium]
MKRILLKLSGEALAGEGDFGIDPSVVDRIATQIAEVARGGTEVGVVLGGGNLFRGAELQAAGMDRVTGDHMGMMATVMNALAFRDMLRNHDLDGHVLSAIAIATVADGYSRAAAVRALEQGRIAIFAAGTGNPFFTTDSAACLRGIEIEADAVLKATKVDGVYDADPKTNPQARKFDELSYTEVLNRELGVMDLTAICLCRDHSMPLVVFDMNEPGALTRIVAGDRVGTLIRD